MNLKMTIASFLAGISVAHADTAADTRALAAAIEDAGCVMTQSNSKDIMAAAGMTAERGQLAYLGLGTLGETVFPAAGVMYFKSPNCLSRSAEDFNDPRLVDFVRLLEDNGCKMSEAVAVDVLPAAGFSKDEVKTMAHKLQASELARFGDSEIVLTTENCL